MKNILLSGILAIGFVITVTAQNYQWAKSIGSSGNDYGNSIAIDPLSNVYVTGSFEGTVDFDPSAATANLTSTGGNDVFFAKYDADGNYLWAKSVGSSYGERGNSIALDVSGNVYVIGVFLGTVDFDPSAATSNLTSAGGNDVFFAKYDADGNYLWAKSVGSSGFDEGTSIALDVSGNVYITGSFNGPADFDPSLATANITSAGYIDVFFAKYDADGNYLWAKAIGGSSNDSGNSITTDAWGNVYVTGYFNSTADFDPSPAIANLTSAGYSDIFFTKYDADGNYLWAKRAGSAGGTIWDVGYSIVIDAAGYVYLAGTFEGMADFDPSPATANLTAIGTGLANVFFAKYDADGNYLWAKNVRGSNYNYYNSIMAVDTAGNVYVTGTFLGIVDFDPSTATANLTAVGYTDVFFAKYDGDGNYLWAKRVGGSNEDHGNSIAVNVSGNVYITGSFKGTADFDPSANTANLTSEGEWDIFIAKYAKATTGINDYNATSNAIAIFPNPTNGKVNFSVQTNVQLINVTGQIVTTKTNVNSLDLSGQPSGIYFVTFTDDKGQVLQRSEIVKE